MKAYLREKKNAKCYYCILKWESAGEVHTKEISTGVPIKGNNKKEAKRRMEEIRLEYENKYEVSKIILFQDLTPQHIQVYYNQKLKQGLSANTVKHHHANIRKALQEAMIQNCIPYNVADRTKLPTIIKYKPVVYNSKQLVRLLNVAQNTPIESVVVICSNYALRRGEVCGIRWEDVDLQNRVIHIRHTRTTAGGEVCQNSTKNYSSTRDYPMNDTIFKYFLKLKDREIENKLFLGKAYNNSGYARTWEDGRPLAVSYVSHAFKTLLEKNGLPHIRFHDIRHSVATNLLENEVNLKLIQEFLGHSSMTTTANFYLHPSMKHKQKVVDTMSRLLVAEH